MMFGHTLYFTTCNEPVAIVNVLRQDSLKREFQLTFTLLNSHLFPVSTTSLIKVVTVSNIREKCIFINIGNSYLARFTSQVTMD